MPEPGYNPSLAHYDGKHESHVPQGYTAHQDFGGGTLSAVPQMLLDQGLVGAALLVCGFVIWKIAKKMDQLNDKVLAIVEKDAEFKAKMLAHVEGVERELEIMNHHHKRSFLGFGGDN